MNPMNMYQEALKEKETIVEDRRYLHRHPELGLDLPETADYVEKRLREMGYAPKRIGKCGLVAAAGRKEGPCILLRADMDALPVKEEAEVDFPSDNGNMHACGHDCHAASLLEAARLLKAHEDELEGRVKLMFQPGEETMNGAKMMVENGVLEEPKADAALGIHVFTNMPMPVGTVLMMGAEGRMAAVDWFTIEITGKGCHGASPQEGVDPLNVMAHIHLALQTINSREMNPSDNIVLTIGEMHGGSVANAIPSDARMSGTIRTLKEETRTLVKTRMEAIVSGVAAAFGAEAHVEYSAGCPVLTQDRTLYAEVKDCLASLKGVTVLNADDGGKPMVSMASEDFAYVASKVPGVFLYIAAGQPEEGYGWPQHHAKARFREEVLPVAAAAYAHIAMEWLKRQH